MLLLHLPAHKLAAAGLSTKLRSACAQPLQNRRTTRLTVITCKTDQIYNSRLRHHAHPLQHTVDDSPRNRTRDNNCSSQTCQPAADTMQTERAGSQLPAAGRHHPRTTLQLDPQPIGPPPPEGIVLPSAIRIIATGFTGGNGCTTML